MFRPLIRYVIVTYRNASARLVVTKLVTVLEPIQAAKNPGVVCLNFTLRGQFFRNFGWGFERYGDFS